MRKVEAFVAGALVVYVAQKALEHIEIEMDSHMDHVHDVAHSALGALTETALSIAKTVATLQRRDFLNMSEAAYILSIPPEEIDEYLTRITDA